MIRKIVDIFLDDDLAKQPFLTGIVYKLEDGNYLLTAQDGFVQPASVLTPAELEEIRSK